MSIALIIFIAISLCEASFIAYIMLKDKIQKTAIKKLQYDITAKENGKTDIKKAQRIGEEITETMGGMESEKQNELAHSVADINNKS